MKKSLAEWIFNPADGCLTGGEKILYLFLFRLRVICIIFVH